MSEPSVQDDFGSVRRTGTTGRPIVSIDEKIRLWQKLPCGDALDLVAEIVGAVGQQSELCHRRIFDGAILGAAKRVRRVQVRRRADYFAA
ncbi:MAG: hypothetical protein WB764_04325 [Xanthobacteraceae bacterium]